MKFDPVISFEYAGLLDRILEPLVGKTVHLQCEYKA